MASLVASLLLLPLAAEAGTYTVTYSGGTITAVGQSPTDPLPAFSAGGGDYGASADVSAGTGSTTTPASCSVTIQGPLTATFTWVPASGQTSATDPPPSAAIVEQDCSAGWTTTNTYHGGTGTGSADSGLPENVSPPAGPSGGSDNTDYSAGAGGASFSVSCASMAKFTGSVGGVYYQGVSGTASVSYHAQVFPVILSVGGTTLDSSQNPNILVGQLATGTVTVVTPNNQPFPCGLSNFQWNVSGTTFESWTVSSDQSHTTEVDAIPATNSTSWYWNDPANAPETVSCTVTVTPPTGDGSPFTLTVTAPKPISVQVPNWTAYGAGGQVSVDTNAPGQNGGYALHAGPTYGQTPVGPGGMNWSATSTTPPLFGTGTLEIVQTVTPSASFMLFPTPSKQYNDPENGLYGLDTGYPYPGPAYSEGTVYQTDDSPSIGLSSAIGSVTMQHSFTDYLMYEPPGSAEWVPLATFTWSTNGNADVPFTDNWADYLGFNGSPAAGTVTPTGQASFTAGNTFPSWNRINVFPNLSYWN